MISEALNLQDQGLPLSSLPPPPSGPAKPLTAPSTAPSSSLPTTPAPAPPTQQDEPLSFKDLTESWCAENDLTLLPLREAHPGTGAPLFRISASATGKGGVVVYFRGDLVWCQKRKREEGFEPVGLGEGLLARAEGR